MRSLSLDRIRTFEAPVLNARIRKRWRTGQLKHIGLIGANAPLTYPVTHLGAGTNTLAEVASGKHSFAQVLRAADKPMIILGQGAFARVDGLAVRCTHADRAFRM